jgi:hypothetical protein
MVVLVVTAARMVVAGVAQVEILLPAVTVRATMPVLLVLPTVL